MKENSCESFAGFGCHLVNDLLAMVPLHPATPARDICSNDILFRDFETTICTFMDQWTSKAFRSRICTRSNNANPFAFSAVADALYASTYIFVYRKAIANVPTKLYNRLVSEGLLDPRHTIGELNNFAILFSLTYIAVHPRSSIYISSCTSTRTVVTEVCSSSSVAAQIQIIFYSIYIH